MIHELFTRYQEARRDGNPFEMERLEKELAKLGVTHESLMTLVGDSTNNM